MKSQHSVHLLTRNLSAESLLPRLLNLFLVIPCRYLELLASHAQALLQIHHLVGHLQLFSIGFLNNLKLVSLLLRLNLFQLNHSLLLLSMHPPQIPKSLAATRNLFRVFPRPELLLEKQLNLQSRDPPITQHCLHNLLPQSLPLSTPPNAKRRLRPAPSMPNGTSSQYTLPRSCVRNSTQLSHLFCGSGAA